MKLDDAYRQLNLVQDFIPKGNSNRPGGRLDASSITIHNTDNTTRGAGAAAHARYQKGPDAQQRQVSWHYTVDDNAVYQSLPTNEIGWHTARPKGNASSIGIEICMNADLDVAAAYERAALLVAVVARKERLSVPSQIFQHHDWSGKNCPIILRSTANGWSDFLARAEELWKDLSDADSIVVNVISDDAHHADGGAAFEAPLFKAAVAASGAVLNFDEEVEDTEMPGAVAIAWGRSVDAAFKSKVVSIASHLRCDPSHLMAAMAFETGQTFSPSIQNRLSHATGLIQFMPATAVSLGTTVATLALMTAVDQLDWVAKYLNPYAGRMHGLSDVYMTILYPAAVGKPEAHILFASGTRAYDQNRGLDVNDDGTITKGEATSKVQAMLDRGLADAYRG